VVYMGQVIDKQEKNTSTQKQDNKQEYFDSLFRKNIEVKKI